MLNFQKAIRSGRALRCRMPLVAKVCVCVWKCAIVYTSNPPACVSILPGVNCTSHPEPSDVPPSHTVTHSPTIQTDHLAKAHSDSLFALVVLWATTFHSTSYSLSLLLSEELADDPSEELDGTDCCWCRGLFFGGVPELVLDGGRPTPRLLCNSGATVNRAAFKMPPITGTVITLPHPLLHQRGWEVLGQRCW